MQTALQCPSVSEPLGLCYDPFRYCLSMKLLYTPLGKQNFFAGATETWNIVAVKLSFASITAAHTGHQASCTDDRFSTVVS